MFVWGFTPYQRYFSYLTATVHKINPCFLDNFLNQNLTSPLSWHWRTIRSAFPRFLSAKGEGHYYQFLAHLSTDCSVSYCDHSPSVVVRPSVHNFLVNSLASTNIKQSAPNLVRMYMTIRSRMSSIMEVITNQHQTWSECI